jgi:cell division protease FtsH
MFSKAAIWVVIAVVLFTVFKQFETRATGGSSGLVAYSDFLEEVRSGRVKNVLIQEAGGSAEIVATTSDDKKFRTVGTYLDRGLIGDLVKSGVKFEVKQREEQSLLLNIFAHWCLGIFYAPNARRR